MTDYDFSLSGRPAYRDPHYFDGAFIDTTLQNATSGDYWYFFVTPSDVLLKRAFAIRTVSSNGTATIDVLNDVGSTFESNLDLNGTGYIVINDLSMPRWVEDSYRTYNWNPLQGLGVHFNRLGVSWDQDVTKAKFWIILEYIDLRGLDAILVV